MELKAEGKVVVSECEYAIESGKGKLKTWFEISLVLSAMVFRLMVLSFSGGIWTVHVIRNLDFKLELTLFLGEHEFPSSLQPKFM